MIALIWAQSANGVIGRDGAIPWRLPEEQQHFKRLTLGATVVMGRGTWDSLPASVRPLPGRTNVVLTRDPQWRAEGARVSHALPAAIEGVDGDVWVIGGASVYREALPLAERIVRTDVDLTVDGDVTAPVLGEEWHVVDTDPPQGWHQSATGLRYRVTTFTR